MTKPASMQAAVLENHGAPFRLTDVARPVPHAGQVLVRIMASGVNPLDLKIRAGAAEHARHPLPAILGIDLAGVVEAVGPDVTDFRVGDEVYGMTGGVGAMPGSLAGYQVADARLVAPKPRNLSMAEAAALPLAVITAWEGLVDRAQVGSGCTVLVHGGAGGVGHVAVQLAVARGAQVYATGTGAAIDAIRLAGATAIDYRASTVEEYVGRYTGGDGFDVIFDTIGGATLDASFTAVRYYTGRVVSILGWGTHTLAPLSFRGASYSGVFTLLPLLTGRGRGHHGEILRQAAALAEKGALRPRLHGESFSLTDVPAAHDVLDAGSPHGRVVIDVASH
jgi:NADPH:quinone reductase